LAEEKETTPKTKSAENNSNLIAALSYFWILSVVFYITNKEDKFVVFHAKQGMVLFALSIVLTFIPVIGWLANIGVLIMSFVGAVKAYGNEKYKIAIIGDLAEKINF